MNATIPFWGNLILRRELIIDERAITIRDAWFGHFDAARIRVEFDKIHGVMLDCTNDFDWSLHLQTTDRLAPLQISLLDFSSPGEIVHSMFTAMGMEVKRRSLSPRVAVA